MENKPPQTLPAPEIALLPLRPEQTVATYANHILVSVRSPDDVSLDFYQIMPITARVEGDKGRVDAGCVARIIVPVGQAVALLQVLAQSLVTAGTLLTPGPIKKPEEGGT